MSGTPAWIMEGLAETLDVPVSALHMAVTADNAAALEHQPKACTRKGWWPT